MTETTGETRRKSAAEVAPPARANARPGSRYGTAGSARCPRTPPHRLHSRQARTPPARATCGLPGSATVDGAAHPALAQTGVHSVGVSRVDCETLRTARRQGQLDRSRLPGLVEAGDPVPGGGIRARHQHSVRTRLAAAHQQGAARAALARGRSPVAADRRQAADWSSRHSCTTRCNSRSCSSGSIARTIPL
jgi:hypothetical protein